MYFVFHVDTGTMLSLEFTILGTMEVAAIKEAIYVETKIPIDHQVLLATGGETLEANCKLFAYGAGTDTSPIFLFNKRISDSTAEPYKLSLDSMPAYDIESSVENSLTLPPTFNTLNLRTQLATKICEYAKPLLYTIEKLVRDQFLMQQGWGAVMANLQDVIDALKMRHADFNKFYSQYLERRSHYIQTITRDQFRQDVAMLSEIPILPGLSTKLCDEPNIQMSNTLEDEDLTSKEEPNEPSSLLEWIARHDVQHTVDEAANRFFQKIEEYGEGNLTKIKQLVRNVMQESLTQNNSVIGGIEDRLYALNKIQDESKVIAAHQVELAQAFSKNLERAKALGDTSILNDLCASHKGQLMAMLENHNKLLNNRESTIKGKNELIEAIHYRIKWLCHFQSNINDCCSEMMMSHECVTKIESSGVILQQLHMSPTFYINTVAEVVRRRNFTQEFLMWANDLACHTCGILSEEIARRKQYQSQYEGHFLFTLFPGLEDMPPSFASQPPEPFDQDLPYLTDEDLEELKQKVPQLLFKMSAPDTSSSIRFFGTSNSFRRELPNPAASIEDRIVQAVSAAGLSSNLDPTLLQPAAECSQSMVQSEMTVTQPISSDRGFESETDTEDFEKVEQSSSQVHFAQQEGSTISLDKEESEDSQEMKAKADDIQKNKLDLISSTVGEAVAYMKIDVNRLKEFVLCKRTELDSLITELQDNWSKQQNSLRQQIEDKQQVIDNLIQYQESLKKEMDMLREEKKMQEKAMKSHVSHIASKKNEGERKTRYARSVSESQSCSGEDSILDRKDHEAIVASLEEKFALEREKVIKAERARCEAELSQQLVQAKIQADAYKQAQFNQSFQRIRDQKFEGARSISQDFNRSDLLSSSGSDSPIMRVEPSGRAEEKILSSSLPKGRLIEMSPSSSILTLEANSSLVRDAATSPEPSPRKCTKLSESTNSLIQQGKISIRSCNEGDIVLVIWDENFGTYTILQETSSHTHFLHLDCLCPLGLRAHPRKQYVIGEVVNKEFCQARKAENRFNVQVGSRFYRVRVRSLQAPSKGYSSTA